MLFGITPTPAALGSAVADPSGIDRCYSDLTLGIGVAPRRTTGGQVLVTKTRRQLGRTDERKDLLDHEPRGKTDQEDDREQRIHPCSPLERPSWPLGNESRSTRRARRGVLFLRELRQQCGDVRRTQRGERGGRTRRIS